MAAQMGWTGSQWTALNNLMMAESGWITDNQNPGSSAFGIGQFLDNTWATVAAFDGGITKAQARGNPGLQIKAMLEYIKHRYPGGPAQAWAGEGGGNLGGPPGYAAGTDSAKAGMALVGERGPELIQLKGGEKINNAAVTASMMKTMGYFMGGQTPTGGGISLVFEKGSITLGGGGGLTGYHTSGDVNADAAQFTQAVTTSIRKSTILNNLKMGVPG
jgi:hypothetical protein